MKRMKSATCVVLLMMCISMAVNAQKKMAGIYTTMNAYLDNQLTYSNNNGDVSRINLHTLTPRDYVTIQYNGQHIRLKKDELFAFKLANGNVYRITGGHSYQVLNNNPQLLLYKRKLPVSPKAEPGDQFRYYFSTEDGNIRELTTWNIKQAFPEHYSFPDKVDALFKGDRELLAYDRFHKMYKLERLLVISK